MERRPVYVAGLGALNIDIVETGGPDRAGPQGGDSERAVSDREVERRLAASGRGHAAFLGGSAFNAISMLAQLRLGGCRLGFAGVSSEASYGADESHRDRMARLGIDDLTRHSQAMPGLCVGQAGAHGRVLRTSPRANLEIADYLDDPGTVRSVAKADVLHLTSFYEDPDGPPGDACAAAVASFVRRVRAANPALLLSFDPGEPWAQPSRVEPLRRIYRAADIVFVNAREFELLAQDSGNAGAIGWSVRRLCGAGATIVLKRLDQIQIQAPAGYVIARIARPDSRLAVVDPTGAGDAICAGVLAAICARRTVAAGCELGMRIAAHRISDYGDRGHADLLGWLGTIWP